MTTRLMQHLCQSMQEEKICNMRKDKTKPTGVARTFREEHNIKRENAIKQLERFKAFEASHNMYHYRFPNGMIISASTKEGLEEMKAALEAKK